MSCIPENNSYGKMKRNMISVFDFMLLLLLLFFYILF